MVVKEPLVNTTLNFTHLMHVIERWIGIHVRNSFCATRTHQRHFKTDKNRNICVSTSNRIEITEIERVFNLDGVECLVF